MEKDKRTEKAIEASDEMMSKESLRVQKAAWVGRRIEKQREIEDEKWKKLQKEQQLLDERKRSIEESLDQTREMQQYNEECRADISSQVYAMHGLTGDKLEGMREYKNAYYQGLAFGLFFLSAVMILLCAWLHGFASDICLFMLACTGIEGALLSQESKRGKLFDLLCRILYIFIFPAMLTIFVCYELEFPEYDLLLPIFAIAGIAILLVGTSAYFFYNPYRKEKKNIRSAKGDLRKIEQFARKEVKKNRKIREKEEIRLAKKEKKEEAKLARKQKKEEEKFTRLRKKEEIKFARRKKKEEVKSQKLHKKEEIREVRRQEQRELHDARIQNRTEQKKQRKMKMDELRTQFLVIIKKSPKEGMDESVDEIEKEKDEAERDENQTESHRQEEKVS